MPELSSQHVVKLLLALGSDCAAKDAPEKAEQFYALPDIGGTDVTAGGFLSALIDDFADFANGPPEINDLQRVDICGNVPAVRVVTGHGEYNFATSQASWHETAPTTQVNSFHGSVLLKIAYDLIRPDRGVRSAQAMTRELDYLDTAK